MRLEDFLTGVRHRYDYDTEFIIVADRPPTFYDIDKLAHHASQVAPLTSTVTYHVNHSDLPFAQVIQKAVDRATGEQVFFTKELSWGMDQDTQYALTEITSKKVQLIKKNNKSKRSIKGPILTVPPKFLHTGERLPISVLMTTYAGTDASHLNQAILSILHQSHRPEELVLVLDGPIPQNQRKIINVYQRAHSLGNLPINITIVDPLWKQSKFLATALNEGLKHCSQPWIARMDADDICFPDRFLHHWEEIHGSLQQNKNIQIFASSALCFNESLSNVTDIVLMPRSDEAINAYIKAGNNLVHPTVLLDAEFISAIGGYDPTFRFLQDLDLWQRACEAGAQFRASPRPILNFRTNRHQRERRESALSYYGMCLQRAVSNAWMSQQTASLRLHEFHVTKDYLSRNCKFGADIRELIDVPTPPKLDAAVIENLVPDPDAKFGEAWL
tara:strand:- start:192 stop:1523 length:1332 start_codon:yes stop_codon:yes gene_type:complete